MAINKCYNKYSGIYYAYETTYEWDEAHQKKVRRKRCVGHFDPVTGEVVPNGIKGKQYTDKGSGRKTRSDAKEKVKLDLSELDARIDQLDQIMAAFAKNYQNLSADIHRIVAKQRKKNSKVHNFLEQNQEEDGNGAA